VERENRMALRKLIEELILERTGSYEFVAQFLDFAKRFGKKWINTEARVRVPPLPTQSPGANREEVLQLYAEVASSIANMSTKDMFHLYSRLKQHDVLLIDTLKSIPKLPTSSRYRPVDAEDRSGETTG
jgi:hypothetical protein